jgi:hypothetical protein
MPPEDDEDELLPEGTLEPWPPEDDDGVVCPPMPPEDDEPLDEEAPLDEALGPPIGTLEP